MILLVAGVLLIVVAAVLVRVALGTPPDAHVSMERRLGGDPDRGGADHSTRIPAEPATLAQPAPPRSPAPPPRYEPSTIGDALRAASPAERRRLAHDVRFTAVVLWALVVVTALSCAILAGR